MRLAVSASPASANVIAAITASILAKSLRMRDLQPGRADRRGRGIRAADRWDLICIKQSVIRGAGTLNQCGAAQPIP